MLTSQLSTMEPKTTELNDRLSKLIEDITTSGTKIIDDAQLKEVKKICRTGDSYVKLAYSLLSQQLRQTHSEIRLAAFQLCDELFQRSHLFRELIISDFQDVMELVVGLETETKLPPPKAAAATLKTTALRAVDLWYKKFGEGYKKLSIGYNYLKTCRNVNFQDARASDQVESLNSKRNARLAALKTAKLKKLVEEVKQNEPDILDCVSQLEAGIALLVPKVEMFDDREAPEETETSSNDLRAHGLGGGSFSITINVQPNQLRVVPNSDNQAIIDFLKEQYFLLSTKLMPLASKWNSLSSKLNATEEFVKKILDMKLSLENVRMKYQDLGLPVTKEINSGSEDDSDFEVVEEKEGYEETVVEPSFHMNRKEDFEQPGPSSYMMNKSEEPDNSKIWSCRAPLPSGRLCPRKDRHKCPLHGVIVARDELGTPRDPQSALPKKDQVPDWQDPVLLAEIKAATGVDLTMPTKGKRLKKAKYPNLTDLKAEKNTARARLEKKIFKQRGNAAKKLKN